jgi:hypothetical protein
LEIQFFQAFFLQKLKYMTREQIEMAVKAKGYSYFEKGEYNVNIVGIRNLYVGNDVTNKFDDWITLSYKVNGEWKFHIWEATTDPGKKYTVDVLLNKKGVARLIPNQYRGTYQIDKHQGKYDALCQRLKPVRVYRDANRNLKFDEDLIDEGMFGINIHKAGRDSSWIEGHSAGCQVFKRVKDFDEFMSICKKAAKIHGNSFTYTLITTNDLNIN